MIICPVCKKKLVKVDRTYVCDKRHSFDIAKQGYVNLYLQSSKNSGDNKEMVNARTAFLEKDFYLPLRNAVCEILDEIQPSVIVDAGCGEGYYTSGFYKENRDIYAFDLSKDALKRASRNNKNIHYILSSIFDMPLQDACADVLLNIFAPLANKEYHRIVREGGYLIKVDPNVKHLYEMKDVLYDTVTDNEILDLEVEGFTLESYKEVTFNMQLENEDIKSLFMMTPYFYKTSIEASQRLMALDHLDCRASFIIYIYKKD